MLDLEGLKSRFTPRAQKVLEGAVEESKNRNHFYLGVEHIFLSFARNESILFMEIMEDLKVDGRQVLSFLNEHLSIPRQYSVEAGIKIPHATRNIFKLSMDEAERWGRDEIDSADLLMAIFQDSHNLPSKVLQGFGLDPDHVMQRISVMVKSREGVEEELKRKYELPSNLKHFAVNLNKLAYYDKLPAIIGRESEIDQMIEVLYHVERSNSVMIVGEPGVGKTAVVEGLARRIELEPHTVPKRLTGEADSEPPDELDRRRDDIPRHVRGQG